MATVVGSAMAGKKKICLELKVKGIVQGVGFRPFVYHLALKHHIKGWVRNESDGVLLVIEGTADNIDAFYQGLVQDPPPLARIHSIGQRTAAVHGYNQFTIDFSRTSAGKGAAVPPDIAACSRCLGDMMNPQDRHYGYPFTNCTNCGPRFTITETVPYDRANTSMKLFPPCEACAYEYHDPADRRFHAQPVACPLCGPQVQILDHGGRPVSSGDGWLRFFWDQIGAGKIFAVKSLGGYHLACSTAEAVIAELRQRKNRPGKPLALMCRDLETVSKYCEVTETEADWLASPAAPVILLPAMEGCPLPANINPGLSTLGLMLPCTPLHHLIMQGPFDVLILTSANLSGLPMIKDDEEALASLKGIADFFLTHNRGIIQRCDDSVARVVGNRIQLHRRSRGFTPAPVEIDFNSEAAVLGAGAEMKNTFCLLKGSQAFLSQHLGEMDTVEAEMAYLDSLNRFLRSFNFKISAVAYDMHPHYRISSLARELPAGKYYGIYHHHAHFLSCLAENGHNGKAIGVILDGTGYGTDGAVWGFEVISGDYLDFTREFFQRYTLLPGGDAAVKWPWRMALSYLRQAMGMEGLTLGRELFERQFEEEFPIVSRQLETGLQSAPTSSCGRIFDAVSAILGICYRNTYEGQAAVELSEMLSPRDVLLPPDPYPFVIKEKQIDFCPMFPELLSDMKSGKNKVLAARRFHDTVVKAVAAAVQMSAEETGLRTVALSGGTWLNPYLVQKTRDLLKEQKFQVLLHSNVPPNDGGLSLGQAAAAYWRWKKDVPGNPDEIEQH
ncbi:MAG: carbamoyltransferase HypF [Bacillota bacterium]